MQLAGSILFTADVLGVLCMKKQTICLRLGKKTQPNNDQTKPENGSFTLCIVHDLYIVHDTLEIKKLIQIIVHQCGNHSQIESE